MSEVNWEVNDEVEELIPGMAEQGKAVEKIYVESEYAPLKAAYVGNPDVIWCPDPSRWEYGNLIRYESDYMKNYWLKHGGKMFKDTDPKMYDQMVKESDALAAAYRQAGVTLLRNETGSQPDVITDYSWQWSGQKCMSLFAQSAGEVIGHNLVQMWEVSTSYTEFVIREAVLDIFSRDPESRWLTMPVNYPVSHQKMPGPFFSPGDILIFKNMVVCGIGVGDPSHVKDLSKPRTSCDELGVNILKRMLEPLGIKVETVYFNANNTYHIDCLISVLDEGLLAHVDDALYTPLPKELQDWEVITVSHEDQHAGCNNNVPLGNKRVVMLEDTGLGKELNKRGWEVIEVPYRGIYKHIGSGIHCSTLSIHRESD
jgi:N-dimethylarginine dimethylaminohydrolase